MCYIYIIYFIYHIIKHVYIYMVGGAGVGVPPSPPVRMSALLGAWYLINFRYFSYSHCYSPSRGPGSSFQTPLVLYIYYCYNISHIASLLLVYVYLFSCTLNSLRAKSASYSLIYLQILMQNFADKQATDKKYISSLLPILIDNLCMECCIEDNSKVIF